MVDNDCNNACKLIETNYSSLNPRISCSTEPEYNKIIDPKILIKEQTCIYKKSNEVNKGLEIDPKNIYLSTNDNCWGHANKIDTSNNNMGIIDKVDGKYIKKCCSISKLVIPHNKIAPDEKIFDKCKIINTDNTLMDDTGNIPTISEICKHNSNSNMTNSKETIHFCKKYKCCSSHNDEDII